MFSTFKLWLNFSQHRREKNTKFVCRGWPLSFDSKTCHGLCNYLWIRHGPWHVREAKRFSFESFVTDIVDVALTAVTAVLGQLAASVDNFPGTCHVMMEP